jgi:hypothetical protein
MSQCLYESPQSPTGGMVGGQYTDMLDAFMRGLPGQEQAQATYQPQYTELGLKNLEEEMMGTPGTPGYLDIYGNQVAPALSRATADANAAGLASAETGLASAGTALRTLNPGTGSLTDALTRTATGQLSLGTQVDPATSTAVTSGVRNNWANRGLGTSQPASLDEALQLYAGGQSLLARRQQQAGQTATLTNNLMVNPALDLMQRSSSSVPGQAQSLTTTGSALGANAGPSVVPTSDLADLFGTVYNSNAANSISNANAGSALCGSAISGASSIAGSAMKMGTGGGGSS